MEKVKILCSGFIENFDEKEMTLEAIYKNIVEKLKISNENSTFSLFESHGLVAYFEYRGKDIEFILSKSTFEENILYYITIKYNEDEVISLDDLDLDQNVLYNLKVDIKHALEKLYSNIYWQKDTQNEKIVTYLYFKVHEVENRFKHLISDYMIRKYTVDWFKNNMSYEIYQKHQSNLSWFKKSKYDTFKNIRTEMFEFKDVDLIKILKESRIDGKIAWEKEKFDVIFGYDIEHIISEISQMRKIIDNSKPICSELAEDMINITESILHRFNNAEHIINRKLKSQEQKDIILQIREEKNSSNLGSAYVYEDEFIEEQYIIQELSYREDIREFFKLLRDYRDEIKVQVTEIKENYSDIFSFIDSSKVEESKQKLKYVNEIIHLSDQFSRDRFDRYISIMKDSKGIELMRDEMEELSRKKLSNISDVMGKIAIFKIEELEEGKVVELVDMIGNILKVEVENWFAQSVDKFDQVFFNIEYNGEECAEYKGKIEVSYLDYDFMHESVNKPLWPNKIDVDISKLTEYVKKFKQKNTELFDEIMVKLNKVKK